MLPFIWLATTFSSILFLVSITLDIYIYIQFLSPLLSLHLFIFFNYLSVPKDPCFIYIKSYKQTLIVFFVVWHATQCAQPIILFYVLTYYDQLWGHPHISTKEAAEMGKYLGLQKSPFNSYFYDENSLASQCFYFFLCAFASFCLPIPLI